VRAFALRHSWILSLLPTGTYLVPAVKARLRCVARPLALASGFFESSLTQSCHSHTPYPPKKVYESNTRQKKTTLTSLIIITKTKQKCASLHHFPPPLSRQTPASSSSASDASTVAAAARYDGCDCQQSEWFAARRASPGFCIISDYITAYKLLDHSELP